MGYAGQEYGSGGAYSGNGAGVGSMSFSGLSVAHASAVIVLAALLFLMAIRMGFRGVSVGRLTGGIVRG